MTVTNIYQREEGLLRDIENIKNMYRDSNNTITRLRSDYESLTSINEIYKTDIQNAKRVICYLLAQYKLCIMAKLILQSFLENIGKKNEQLSEVLSILKSNISTTKDSVNSTLPMILNLNSSMDNVTERLAGTEILLDKKDRVNAAAKFIAAKTLLKFASMSESVSTLKNLITDMDTKYKDKFSRLTSDRDLTLRESADAAAHAENEIINLKQKIGELQSQKFELESLIVKIGNEKEREILDCEDRARQLSNRLAEASGQIARLSDQLSSSDSCLKHIKESEDVLRAELELTKNEKVEMCQRLSDDNARFKLHCTELTREISVISEKLQKKQVEYTDIQNELAEIKNASSVVANDLNEIQDKYTSLESSHSQLLQKYASLSESLSKITREKMDIDSTLINANNKLAESAECNARMNKEINELKKKNIDQRDYYETRLAEISEKLNYTARNLENSENKIVLVSNEISTKNTQHKKKIEDLESEICRIKDAAQNNHIIISKKLVQTESSLILAESKIKELSTDNESLASSIKLEREKLNVCENILKKYGYDIGSKVFDLKSELKAKNELVEKLSKDVEDLNAKLEHFRSFNYSENPSLKDYGADELSRLRGEVASLRFEKHRSVFEIGQTMMQYRERIAELERKLTECSTRGHSPFNTTSHA